MEKKGRRATSSASTPRQKMALGALMRTVRYLKPHQVWERLHYKARCVYYRSPLYPAIEDPLVIPDRLLTSPPHLWLGDKQRGDAILNGTFTFVGRTLHLGKDINWHPREASALWVYNLHYFEWLADLRTLKQNGQEEARHLIEDWLRTCGTFHPVHWHPYPLSLRLISWLTHADWFLEGASDEFTHMFYESLAFHADHLERVLEWDVGGNHLIKNLKATIYAGLTLPDNQSAYLDAMELLLKQLRMQILPDGSHYERSPHYHVDVLRDLLDIHAVVKRAGQKIPPELDVTIERMATALEFYLYPDGCLGLWNDGDIGHAKHLSDVLKRCGHTGQKITELAAAGYVKLARGKTHIMFDAGLCGPHELPAHAHADTLSFEMMHGRERIFTNCGTYAYQDPLRNTLRGTAAHNTVCVDRENSAEVWSTFRLGRRPENVTYHLHEEKKVGVGVDASHDGYRHKKVTHTRKIFMSEDGKDIRGEDVITGKKNHSVAAHFHMPPHVRYSLVSNEEALIESSEGIKFSLKVAGGRLHDAQSHYAPHFGEKEGARQLVLRGNWGPKGATLKWAIKVL